MYKFLFTKFFLLIFDSIHSIHLILNLLKLVTSKLHHLYEKYVVICADEKTNMKPRKKQNVRARPYYARKSKNQGKTMPHESPSLIFVRTSKSKSAYESAIKSLENRKKRKFNTCNKIVLASDVVNLDKDQQAIQSLERTENSTKFTRLNFENTKVQSNTTNKIELLKNHAMPTNFENIEMQNGISKHVENNSDIIGFKGFEQPKTECNTSNLLVKPESQIEASNSENTCNNINDIEESCFWQKYSFVKRKILNVFGK